MATYPVKKGDCLWSIAKSQLGDANRWPEIASLNNIKSPYTIYVGNVLQLPGGTSTTPPPKPTPTAQPVINFFGLQAGTERDMFLAWSFDNKNAESFRIMWYYDVAGQWVVGGDSNTHDASDDYRNYVYSVPAKATQTKVKVFPNSKKYKDKKGNEVAYFGGKWSSAWTYSFANNPPLKPDVPNVEIDGYKLTAELDNINTEINADTIEFEITKDNASSVYNVGKASIVNRRASYSCSVDAGAEYKVRCRALRGSASSEWSDYSGNTRTIPAAPAKLITCKAASKTSVYLEWSKVDNADTYDIEYTTKITYFDGSDKTTTVSGIEFTKYEKTGLDTGEKYFFRVRAVNDKGHSGWSEIKSTIIGKAPAAPTTWSSTTTATVGDPLTLYWVHNAEDGSTQTFADLEVIIVGVITIADVIKNDRLEDEKDKTSSYSLNTSLCKEGANITWRVRTAGITQEFGKWSVLRTIDIYAPPTLVLRVNDYNGIPLTTLRSFPFIVDALAGPKTQSPVGYHLTITSNEVYETIDQVGNVKMVNKDEPVYAKYFDTSDPLLVEMSANNLDLENNVTYTVTCTVSMNSGLTATASREFKVAWTDDRVDPNAEVIINDANYTANIRPYCEDAEGVLIPDILLSVYRREFDGTFTELSKGLKNTRGTFITDPHPALDYARYRIVAITQSTGAVSFYDMPGIPVGGIAAIIQWDEKWSNFDATIDDELEQPPWAGSMLQLPYNISVSDRHSNEVSLVEYVGRKHPVTYYGTQLGETSSWTMDIPKKDKETLYAIRRLAIYNGDVYVREPSGSGYWANVTVSFSQKYKDVTIPVNLDIKRVEGGV